MNERLWGSQARGPHSCNDMGQGHALRHAPGCSLALPKIGKAAVTAAPLPLQPIYFTVVSANSSIHVL